MTRVAGNLQRIVNGKRRYAITPRIPGGFVQPEMLTRIAEVAQKFDGVLKITGAQRIMITNLKAEDLESAWHMLGLEPSITNSNVVRSVRICPGTTFCKRGKQDAVHLGMQLERKYISQEMPSKIKMGVSGCPNSCAEAITKDIGVIGTTEGWEVYAGGSAGAHPRLGDFIAFFPTEEEVLALVERILTFYKEHAIIERMGQFIDRIGIEAFRAAVLDDMNQHPAPTTATAGIHTPEPSSSQTVEYTLRAGDPITEHSIIRNIIDVYPATVPVLQGIGMGCLGCPSATAEPLWQAAQIHGVNIDELVASLNAVR